MNNFVAMRINSIAVIRVDTEWWIVRRVLDDVSGLFQDVPIEGPFAGEGQAEQRASAIAVKAGDAAR